MTEKNSNETKVSNHETSRRSFLKTSAAIAGAEQYGEPQCCNKSLQIQTLTARRRV
jgi:hypothetical protein